MSKKKRTRRTYNRQGPQAEVGQRFSFWTVLLVGRAYKAKEGTFIALCECDCGTKRWVRINQLNRRISKSCGCQGNSEPEPVEVGYQYGLLTVLCIIARGNHGKPGTALCECECGNKTVARLCNLTSGGSKSCGCARKKDLLKWNTTHGKSKTATWKRWVGMRRRCLDVNGKDYPQYGGNGIKIADRWGDYDAFLADVGECPSPKYSLDRFPNCKGNYEPGNVRWASSSEQARNKWLTVFLTHNGKRQPLATWAEELGVSYCALHSRLERCWPVSRIFGQPFSPREIRVSFNGKTKNISDWARAIGIPIQTLLTRRRRGWSITRMLEQPLRAHTMKKRTG